MTTDLIPLTDDQLLEIFDKNPKFKISRDKWKDPSDTDNFCKFIRAVHDTGLDIWHVNINNEIRFGRNGGKTKVGDFVLGRVIGIKPRKLVWNHDLAGMVRSERKGLPLTSDLVEKLENILKNKKTEFKNWKHIGDERPGYWPNQIGLEEDEDEENKSVDDNVSENKKQAINIIYYGPPGTGKTFKLLGKLKDDYTDKGLKRYEFVTFHQSYGYEDFVEGLRPVITNTTQDSSKAAGESNGEIRYEIKNGVFLRLCERARKDPEKRYAMVIDEINRGNISKIFGELITLIEADKRKGEKNEIGVVLPYSGNSFCVPANVDVIGTMNTADRSLALIDTALRRRFEFEAVMPDSSVLKGIDILKDGENVGIDIVEMLTKLNDRIEVLYDRDHTVGHAYFTSLKDNKNNFAVLQAIFKNKIIPLLEEYFFEDWQKIRLVLGDNQKKSEDNKFIQEKKFPELFGSNPGLDIFRPRYILNPAALKIPKAYVEIYEKS